MRQIFFIIYRLVEEALHCIGARLNMCVGIIVEIEYCECWSCYVCGYLMFRQMWYICTCV